MATRRRRARLWRGAALALTVVILVGLAYVALVAWRSRAPVTLPRPPGGHAVGRVEAVVSDPARDGRRISVWTWYPAVAGTGRPAAYAPGHWAGLGIDLPIGETALDRVHDVAAQDATPAPGRFPVVVLAPGLGFAAPQYAVLAENLASRGYVVVGVTPTGSANLTVLGDEVVRSNRTDNPSDFNGEQTGHDRAIGERLLRLWVADVRLAADHMERAPGVLAGHLDERRIAYVGHSFGGATALQACHDDPRCAAAVDLDGPLYGSVATDGLRVPTLLVGHDGSCITGDCSPASASDRADRAAALAFRDASAGVRVATIADTGHLDFTDDAVYYWAWPLRRLLGLGSADPRAALAHTSALIAEVLAAGGLAPR